jgi:hypothetical protein
MALHPDDRPQDVEAFRQALLGNWTPPIKPMKSLPNPTMMDILSSPIERTLAGITIAVLLVSLLVTLMN